MKILQTYLIVVFFIFGLFLITGCSQTEGTILQANLDKQSVQRSGNDDDDDDGLEFKADLTGDQEVPPVVTNTTGEIKVEFNDDLTEAEFELEVRDGVAITQAHLHCAPAGVNGPVMAFLFGFVPGGFDVDGDLVEFTLTDANIAAVGADCVPTIGMAINNIADLAQAMQDGNIYANVHSVANPPGEVRGQLESDDDDDDDNDDDNDKK